MENYAENLNLGKRVQHLEERVFSRPEKNLLMFINQCTLSVTQTAH